AGPGRTALVTDATAAAGMPDGTYHLGGRPVTVSGGVVRLAGPDGSPAAAGAPLAGSTLTMDAALRRAIRAGLSIVEAARAAATTPARAIGLGGTLGAIAPGLRADLVVLDPDLRGVRVVRAGTTVAGRGGRPGAPPGARLHPSVTGKARSWNSCYGCSQ